MGGSTIIGSNTLCAAGVATPSAAGTASPIGVTGLTNGTVYRCSVTAAHALGTSLGSSIAPATPALPNVPAAPTTGAVTSADKAALMAFLRTLDDPILLSDAEFSNPMRK